MIIFACITSHLLPSLLTTMYALRNAGHGSLLIPVHHVTSKLHKLAFINRKKFGKCYWVYLSTFHTGVAYRIMYQLCLYWYAFDTHAKAPCYLTKIVTQTSSVTSRSRRMSGSSLRYEQPRTRLTFGQRAFSYAAPKASEWRGRRGRSLPPPRNVETTGTRASFRPRNILHAVL